MKDVRSTFIGESHEQFYNQASPEAIKASYRASSTANKGSAELGKELGLTDDINAKYKIELTFGPKRTTRGPNRVAIQLWESGKRLHGGGDELMFFCKDNRPGEDGGCWSPIPPDNLKNGVAYCSKCSMAINADFLTNMRLGFVTSKFLAGDLVKLFHSLNSNADIYIKYHRSDPRYMAMEKAKGNEVAKRLKGMHIYPLKNILKDTSNGASLENRIFAFITS